MSLKIINLVKGIPYGSLTVYESALLIEIATGLTDEGLPGRYTPSLKTLSKRTHMGISTVKRKIQSLIDKGFLSKHVRQRTHNRHFPNLYKINFNLFTELVDNLVDKNTVPRPSFSDNPQVSFLIVDNPVHNPVDKGGGWGPEWASVRPRVDPFSVTFSNTPQFPISHVDITTPGQIPSQHTEPLSPFLKEKKGVAARQPNDLQKEVSIYPSTSSPPEGKGGQLTKAKHTRLFGDNVITLLTERLIYLSQESAMQLEETKTKAIESEANVIIRRLKAKHPNCDLGVEVLMGLLRKHGRQRVLSAMKFLLESSNMIEAEFGPALTLSFDEPHSTITPPALSSPEKDLGGSDGIQEFADISYRDCVRCWEVLSREEREKALSWVQQNTDKLDMVDLLSEKAIKYLSVGITNTDLHPLACLALTSYLSSTS